jgi:hypothetical protein
MCWNETVNDRKIIQNNSISIIFEVFILSLCATHIITAQGHNNYNIIP